MAREIHLRIDEQLCRECQPCQAAKVCKVKAILQLDPGEVPYLDIRRCYDCRLCLAACPFSAIINLKVTP